MAYPEKPTPTVAATRGTIHFNNPTLPAGERSIGELRNIINEATKNQPPLPPIEELMGNSEQK